MKTRQAKENDMPRAAPAGLAVLLVLGSVSVVWADASNRIDARGSFAQGHVSTISSGRTGAGNDAAKSVVAEEAASFAASEVAPVPSAPFCRRITSRKIVWIKLTEPGGKLIHINVNHVTSVRSDTQVPGARAQIDLTSGKFQGVQESAEQVMQLISAGPGGRETPSAGFDEAEYPSRRPNGCAG
jgi:hypothetical protein